MLPLVVVGCVAVDDQAAETFPRSSGGTYLMRAQVETYGTTPTEVVAAVGASEFPMADRGAGVWEVNAALPRCTQGFQLRYLVRHPAAVGTGTVTFVEPPGATPTVGGFLKRVAPTAALPDCTATPVFRVNSTAFLPDANTSDGVCNANPPGGTVLCTFQAAIDQANAVPGPARIELPAGSYTGGEYFIPRDDVTIVGIASGVVIRTHISITGAAPTVELRNVTLTGGVRSNGGSLRLSAVRVENSRPFIVDAGVMARGLLDIENSTIIGSGSVGVRLTGTHGRIVGSLIANNSSGGGIECAPESSVSAQLAITNTTVTGNTGRFGGVLLWNRCRATLRNTTVAHNQQTIGSGGFRHVGGITLLEGAELQVANSILTDNTSTTDSASADCGAGSGAPGSTISVQSLGQNLVQRSTTCTFQESLNLPDIRGVSAQLLALADNGGPTHTLLPGPASPARSAGSTEAVSQANTAACLPVDQRGVARAPGCDSGAAEVP